MLKVEIRRQFSPNKSDPTVEIELQGVCGTKDGPGEEDPFATDSDSNDLQDYSEEPTPSPKLSPTFSAALVSPAPLIPLSTQSSGGLSVRSWTHLSPRSDEACAATIVNQETAL